MTDPDRHREPSRKPFRLVNWPSTVADLTSDEEADVAAFRAQRKAVLTALNEARRKMLADLEKQGMLGERK